MNPEALEGMVGRRLRFSFYGEMGDYEQGILMNVYPEKELAIIQRGNVILFGKDFGATRKVLIDLPYVVSVKVLG